MLWRDKVLNSLTTEMISLQGTDMVISLIESFHNVHKYQNITLHPSCVRLLPDS
jgi:hypothetical protein